MTRADQPAVDVAIFGAGLAGLSAAHGLRAGGSRVLLEAQEVPGAFWARPRPSTPRTLP